MPRVWNHFCFCACLFAFGLCGRSLGSPSFGLGEDIEAEARTASIEIGDLDGDGDADLCVGTSSAGPSPLPIPMIAWYENKLDTEGGFDRHILKQDDTESTYFVDVADVVGDSKPDIVATDLGLTRILIYENKGGVPPVFTMSPIDFPSFPRGIDCGDMDGDLDTDIVVGSTDELEFVIFENVDRTPNGFLSHPIVTTEGPLYWLRMVEMGNPAGIDVLARTDAGHVFLNRRTTDGLFTFTPVPLSQSANSSRDGFAIDFEEDGDIDIVAGGFIFLSNPGIEPEFTENPLPQFVCNTLVDVDEDADADFLGIVPSLEYGYLAWLEAVTVLPPVFASHPIATENYWIFAVKYADFDGDGLKDVVAGGFTANPGRGKIKLYRQIFSSNGIEMPWTELP